MPKPIVLVDSDREFAEAVATEMRNAGFDVATFTDPLVALTALEKAETVELLITRIRFPPGKPHGVSLAQMTHLKRPAVKVLFVGPPELKDYAAGIGGFMAWPVRAMDLIQEAGRMLRLGRNNSSGSEKNSGTPA